MPTPLPILLTALAIVAAAAPPHHSLEDLRARVAAFAGGTPLIDPRLAVPPCALPVLDWAGPGQTAVSVACPDPAWRIFVAVQRPPAWVTVAAPAAAKPLVHRGDMVTVSADGRGFRVAIDGFAEADGAAGARIRVRNRGSGQVIVAVVAADGSLRVQD